MEKIFSPYNITTALRLAALYSYAGSGFKAKLTILKDYNWVTPDQAEACISILAEHLKGKVKYEDSVIKFYRWPENSKDAVSIIVTGRLDAQCSKSVWELKCVNKLEDEHLLQLALYAWMMSDSSRRRSFRLLNMKTGELVELKSNYDDLESVARVLIEEYLQSMLNNIVY